MSRLKNNHKFTLSACYIGYITQAIVNNFSPLLFITFNREFDIPLDKIAGIVSINFIIQLTVDLLSTKVVDKIGYDKMVVLAHVFSALGLAGLGIFPYSFSSPYAGILFATAITAIGGGLIEVLISPIAQACPVDEKSAGMSLLHSFYCWGHIFVILFSTLYFTLFNISNWRYLAFVWAILPLCNAVLFSRVTIYPLLKENEKSMKIKELFSSSLFWILMIIMVCGGASEQSISQWVSAFAEDGLGISKTLGDLAGSCSFALFMGLSRVIHSKIGQRFDLQKTMIVCTATCIAAYLMTGISESPLIALIGCGVCGFSVGIMWPGTFSIAAQVCPKGGTALFALLALAGDLGCAIGPFTVGIISSGDGNTLKNGILGSIVFPIALILLLVFSIKKFKQAKSA